MSFNQNKNEISTVEELIYLLQQCDPKSPVTIEPTPLDGFEQLEKEGIQTLWLAKNTPTLNIQEYGLKTNTHFVLLNDK